MIEPPAEMPSGGPLGAIKSAINKLIRFARTNRILESSDINRKVTPNGTILTLKTKGRKGSGSSVPRWQ